MKYAISLTTLAFFAATVPVFKRQADINDDIIPFPSLFLVLTSLSWHTQLLSLSLASQGQLLHTSRFYSSRLREPLSLPI